MAALSWLALLPLCSCSWWECWAHSGCCHVVMAIGSVILGFLENFPAHLPPLVPVLFPAACAGHHMSHHQIRFDLPRYTSLSVLGFFSNYAEDLSPRPVKLSFWSLLHSCCIFHMLSMAASSPTSAAACSV